MASRGRPKGSGQYDDQYRLRLSKEQRNKLKNLADKEQTTESNILRKLIEKAFERS